MPGHSFKTSAKRTGWKGLNFGVTLTKLFSCSDSAAVEAKKVINKYNRKKIEGFPCTHTIQKVREQKGGTLNYRPNSWWALIQGRAFIGVWAVNLRKYTNLYILIHTCYKIEGKNTHQFHIFRKRNITVHVFPKSY